MNTVVLNIIGFFQASRVPNLVVIVFVQVFAALFLIDQPFNDFTISFVGLVISTLMIAAGGYIINDYYDQKIDMINRPGKVVVGVKLQRRLAMSAHLLLNILAISLGFWVDLYVGILNFFFVFLLWLYSNQLRRLPLIGNLSIALLHAATILIVMVYYHTITKLALIYAFFAFIISLIREIIKDIEDLKGEAAFGCSTLPVIWGIRGTKLVIYFFGLIGIAILVLFLLVGANPMVQIYFVILSPIFGWFLYKIHQADTKKEYRTLHQIINWIIFSGILSIIFLDE